MSISAMLRICGQWASWDAQYINSSLLSVEQVLCESIPQSMEIESNYSVGNHYKRGQ